MHSIERLHRRLLSCSTSTLSQVRKNMQEGRTPVNAQADKRVGDNSAHRITTSWQGTALKVSTICLTPKNDQLLANGGFCSRVTAAPRHIPTRRVLLGQRHPCPAASKPQQLCSCQLAALYVQGGHRLSNNMQLYSCQHQCHHCCLYFCCCCHCWVQQLPAAAAADPSPAAGAPASDTAASAGRWCC